MHKKYHEKFKILEILAVTTQAHEGIETVSLLERGINTPVTTQAHEGIETFFPPRHDSVQCYSNNSSP